MLPADRVREVSMFGGRAFMLDERMLVCVDRGDGLLVRVSPERDGELMTRPGAGRMTMGSKQLEDGWILVDAEAVADHAGLTFWVQEALRYHAEARA
ncbi:hypothetical protein L3i23_12490 [Herbiconiux sp. L3-i23]|nr:hypothetical protein L3i23_12490 [Herbiconiux sp. L3-i23]